MSLESFYAHAQGDLPGVRGRMLTDERVLKFVNLFLQDTSYADLEDALEVGDLETAFRASHTLRGLAENMGFPALFESAKELTEALRPDEDGQPAAIQEAPQHLSQVRAAYALVKDAAATELATELGNA